ncbi:MAG: GNAT family N-acetyltransferase [Anaerolineales bacterium]|nr:GNAT family N-acetyltransferase [Anaerolineales bacterium]
MTQITIRRALDADREALFTVEAKSTPNLRYLPQVYDLFLHDPRGAFLAAEVDGDLAGCAKLTALPDGSAWLETLRVIPERQGLGVGKRLYEAFFEVAAEQRISTMRMYTGLSNVVSKGLAERYGFELEETFLGYSLPVDETLTVQELPAWQLVTAPARAADLVLTGQAAWHNFLVMNRTFYRLSAALCADLATRQQIFSDDQGNVAIFGARFMPEQALHIGHFAGNANACLAFAHALAAQRSIPRLSCLFPQAATSVRLALEANSFTPDRAPYIVMRRDLD